MSQGLELFFCMAAWWSSKFEASPCSWTSAVGRCLSRGLNYFLVILTGHLNCCSGEAMRVREASLSEASAGGGGAWGTCEES